jgi:hypothetical protein
VNTSTHFTKTPKQLTNTHTIQTPHIHTQTNYKTHTYTHPNIKKPTHTHTHMLQNKLKHAAYNLKSFHANNACDLQEVHILLIPTNFIFITMYVT